MRCQGRLRNWLLLELHLLWSILLKTFGCKIRLLFFKRVTRLIEFKGWAQMFIPNHLLWCIRHVCFCFLLVLCAPNWNWEQINSKPAYHLELELCPSRRCRTKRFRCDVVAKLSAAVKCLYIQTGQRNWFFYSTLGCFTHILSSQDRCACVAHHQCCEWKY